MCFSTPNAETSAVLRRQCRYLPAALQLVQELLETTLLLRVSGGAAGNSGATSHDALCAVQLSSWVKLCAESSSSPARAIIQCCGRLPMALSLSQTPKLYKDTEKCVSTYIYTYECRAYTLYVYVCIYIHIRIYIYAHPPTNG